MKLSVIIVNYNVEQFLEQCLNSAVKALEQCSGEIWVVDNNSIDGSVDMVREKFPQVHLIANKDNLGFSKANNQAMRKANGEYVLLLNPDTVVEEDTFRKVVDFMDEHPKAGGLGVKMLDGKGNFLPESKRGLPTPSVAFSKIFGLSRLFPKSKKFGKYHLGYLDKDEIHKVEILSGAFMMMRKTVLDEIGLLDEAFFMYGEDIDLSYRIIKGGYDNYYFPKTRIIHYKGESTKKSSVNYVFVFYNAMVIFAKKHFSQKNARLFSALINLAIYFRASMAIASRLIKRSIIPAIDILVFTGVFWLVAYIYQEQTHITFPKDVFWYAIVSYSFLYSFFYWISGVYDKPFKITKLPLGHLIGSVIILSVYALLDKSFQFSRAFILIGAATTFFAASGLRYIYHLTNIAGYTLFGKAKKRFVIIGESDECERVSGLLHQTQEKIDFVGHVSIRDNQDGFLGTYNQLDQIIDIHGIDELIFCARDVSAQQTIECMSKFDNRGLDFKIAQPETLFLIGSNSIDTSGDLYMLDVNSISSVGNRRNKRLFDILSALFILPLFPFIMAINKKPLNFFINIFRVLFGKKTWVGYIKNDGLNKLQLPKIKQGIITPILSQKSSLSESDLTDKINLIYAKDYKLSTDIKALIRDIRYLGN